MQFITLNRVVTCIACIVSRKLHTTMVRLTTTTTAVPPLVSIGQGQLKGKVLQDYLGNPFCAFLGIPYAKAPVGALRFKAPQPPEPWSGVRDATVEGPECPSHHIFFQYFIGNEDNCLNLNVFTKEVPEKETEQKLKPVMVWIHGGAFMCGSNKMEFFGPEYLMSRDIVLVVINYRLGVLGFLSMEDPKLEVPGNSGLKDMVMALRWVQNNIHHFMGDPNNVTIFGESAGAASVSYLLLSPMSKGLFHKAILQSGCAINCWARGYHNSQVIAKLIKYRGDLKNEGAILEILQKQSAKSLVRAQDKHVDACVAHKLRPFGPVVERPSTTNGHEAFITKEPIEILRNGEFHRVPVIIGYNSNEGILYGVVQKLKPQAGFVTNFETEIPHDLDLQSGSEKSVEIANRIQKFYFGDQISSVHNVDALYKLKGDNQFVHGIHRTIQMHAAYGPKVYVYRMNVESTLNYYKKICTTKMLTVLFALYYFAYQAGEGRLRDHFLALTEKLPRQMVSGVCHADDLGYLFRCFAACDVKPNTKDFALVQRFVHIWTDFAIHTKPDHGLDVIWQPVTKDEFHFLDIGDDLKCAIDPDVDRMRFWDSLYQLAESI